jgi:hypothetical protein
MVAYSLREVMEGLWKARSPLRKNGKETP